MEKIKIYITIDNDIQHMNPQKKTSFRLTDLFLSSGLESSCCLTF